MYAVIGNPIAHSRSPQIHSVFAQSLGIEIDYQALSAPLEGFSSFVEELRAQGFLGLNVTLPFKVEAAQYAHKVSDRVKAAGAANALKFTPDGVLAENFDGSGLVHDVSVNLAFSLKNKKILILGAGGASRGIIAPLIAQQPESITIVNRSIEKAEKIAYSFVDFYKITACSYETLSKSSFNVVFNATAAGLAAEAPPLPEGVFCRNESLAYDLAYGKSSAPFLRWAQQNGATLQADGSGMLVEQAAESFLWWLGKMPSVQTRHEMIAELKRIA